MVIDVTTFNFFKIHAKFLTDKDININYEVEDIDISQLMTMLLGIPTGSRTTANGYNNNPNLYDYWPNSGFSWGIPVVVGCIVMGLQIDPTLARKEHYNI